MRIGKLAAMIVQAKRVYICGNGGSAANAIHWANDLIAKGIRAHALTADVSTLTAIANDHGYDKIFSRQLRVLAEPGDLLIVLSGSGESRNVCEALRMALEKQMLSAVVTGKFGVRPSYCERNANIVIAAGNTMQQAEELQLSIIHQFFEEVP